MKKWSRFIIRWRTPVAIIALLVTSLLAVSASQINIESDLEFEIDETLPAVAAFAAIESRFGGQTLAQVLIDADRRADLETIEERLENAGTFQFIDGPIHRLQRQGDASGPLNGPGLAEVVSVDYWRIMVGYNEGDQRAIDDVQEAINGISGARLTGADIVQLESQEKVLDSLFLSTGIALALVLTLLFVVFRQPLIALLAFMPLPMILIWQLGLQQLFQIPLNPITGVISAMTLGIGVDYSLHIVAHYQAHRLEGHRAAARQALASVGRPVLAASITTVAAFSVLGLSSLVPLRQFGYTASIVIFSAFVLSLTFLPAMASFGGPAPTHTHAMHGAPIVRERPYVGPR
jgi:predicted RND superfamily exporter protein